MPNRLKIAICSLLFSCCLFAAAEKAFPDDFMDTDISDSTEVFDFSNFKPGVAKQPAAKKEQPAKQEKKQEAPRETKKPEKDPPVYAKPSVLPQNPSSGQTPIDENVDISDSTDVFDFPDVKPQHVVYEKPPKPEKPSPPPPPENKPEKPAARETPQQQPLQGVDYATWIEHIKQLYPDYYKDATSYPETEEDVALDTGVQLQMLTLSTPMHTAKWINWHLKSLKDYVDEAISHVVPGGLTVSGAAGPDSDYEDFAKVTALRFNKDSGFSVSEVEDGGKNYLQVSLGSAWTELIPDKPDPDRPNLRPSGEEKLSIKVVETNETGTFWDYSNTNKNEKTFYIGINKSSVSGEVPYENVYVSSDIIVTNIPYPIGGYTNGAVITNNTSVKEVFANIFSRVLHPTYKAPDLTLNLRRLDLAANNLCEYGTEIYGMRMETLTTKNDGGLPEQYQYFINNVEVDGSPHVTTALNDYWDNVAFSNLTKSTSFKAVMHYSEGPVKPDTSGKPDPYGRIEAGDVSKTVIVTPSRYLFYCTTNAVTDMTLAVVTNSSKRFMASANSFDIPLKTGIKQIMVAIPASVAVNSITFNTPPVISDEIKDSPSMAKTEMAINCLNGYDGDEDNRRTYTIYDYISPNPTVNDASYISVRFSP